MSWHICFFSSECDVEGSVGQVVGQIIWANYPTASKVQVNVFCPPGPNENVAPLQHLYLHGIIEVSLIVCVVMA